jgi:hypothetical protein
MNPGNGVNGEDGGGHDLGAVDESRARTASAALTMLNICAWAYALGATLHALT